MRAALVVVAIVASARIASAHQSSIKYVTLVLDGPRVGVTVKLAPGDVAEAMGLPPDAKPTAAAAAAAPRVPAYVARWLAIAERDEPCVQDPPAARVAADGFVEVAWTVRCARGEALALDFTALFALDKRMEVIVRFGAADDDVVVVRAGDAPVTLRVPPKAPALLGARDAIPTALFAIGLVLFGVPHAQRKRAGRGLLFVFGAVWLTCFGLAGAGTQWFGVHLLQVLAAVSLIALAIDNLVATTAASRIGIAILGGVVHGLLLGTVCPQGAEVAFGFGAVVVALAGAAIALWSLRFPIGNPTVRIAAVALCGGATVWLAVM